MSSARKTLGIIAARCGSSRFPGKVLEQVGGTPLLGYVCERAKRANFAGLVIATTSSPSDDPIATWGSDNAVEVFRGPEDDVAARYLQCVEHYSAPSFARINGDSPWVDPMLINEGLNLFHPPGDDAVTNLVGRTFPYGISVEIVRTETLQRAYPLMNEVDREHVTAFLYRDLEHLKVETLTSSKVELRQARLTVDTPSDLANMERMVQTFGLEALQVSWEAAAVRYLELTANQDLRTL